MSRTRPNAVKGSIVQYTAIAALSIRAVGCLRRQHNLVRRGAAYWMVPWYIMVPPSSSTASTGIANVIDPQTRTAGERGRPEPVLPRLPMPSNRLNGCRACERVRVLFVGPLRPRSRLLASRSSGWCTPPVQTSRHRVCEKQLSHALSRRGLRVRSRPMKCPPGPASSSLVYSSSSCSCARTFV